MRLNKHFLVHHTSDNSFLVPTGVTDFSGLIKGNRTVGIILDCLKVDTTYEEIVRKLHEQLDASEELIRHDVTDTLAKLRSVGAIDE